MSAAVAAPLGLLVAAVLTAESAPLLAVKLLTDAVRGGHHVTFVVFVRCGGV